MVRKLDLKRTMGFAAAIATAGLLMPAPASAQVWYSEACIQYYRDYCVANWQRQGFASSAQCADFYKENACKGSVIYQEYSSLAVPSTGRPD